MDSLWITALWKQFGAAIDMLDNAVIACPDALWQEPLWRDTPPPGFLRQFAEFWYVVFHTLVWLDLYLSGVPEEESLPLLPLSGGCSTPTRRLPNALIPRTSCAPISRLCAKNAVRLSRHCRMSRRANLSSIPGPRDSQSAFSSCVSTTCATSRDMPPN